VRRSLLVATLFVALGIVALTRGAAPTPTAIPVAPAPRPETHAVATPAPIAPLTRNPFEYADEPEALPPTATARDAAPAPRAMTPPIQTARLSGFLRQGGRLRAVLVLNGEVVLLAEGESAEGYTLLAADDETGVRLRGPAGEIMLSLAEP
jgi:hypothetical protein